MFGWLLLLFITLPIVELALLIQVGRILTLGPTIGIVILTGIAGAALAKRQGLRTLARMNAELAAGRMPTRDLAEGLMILLAGAVLVTPGFLTDALGLALLIPGFRRVFMKALTRYFESKIDITRIHPGTAAGPGGFERPDDFADSDQVEADADVGFDPGPHPMKHVKNEALDQ